MDIKDCRIDMKVLTPNGYEAKIVEIQKNGRVFVDFNPRGYNYMPFGADELTPVSDPCTACQKISSIDKCCEYWRTECKEARRNAAYWCEELEKLQKEALAECPNWQPELSHTARRVIEYLTAMNRPLYIGGILEGMKDIMSGMTIMDGIMEARDAGRIRLVDGKYEIVRD